MKSSFQAQIDEYNSSIDGKIDGAIAAYLAGIKLSSEFQQECYPMGIECKFYNEFVPITTNLGTAYKYFMYVALMSCSQDGSYISEWKVSNYNGDLGAWITKNETNKDLFIQYTKNNVNGETLNYITSKVLSLPCAGISATGISMSEEKSVSLNMGSFTVDYSPLENWGATDWSKNLSAGAGLTAVGIKSYTVEDEISYLENEDSGLSSLNHFSGTELPSVNVHSLLDTDYHTIGDKIATAKAQAGYRTGKRGSQPTSQAVNKNNYGINIFRHKYHTLNWTDFSNRTYSSRANMDVRYYSGVPLFKATNDGEATVKFILSNSEENSINTFHLSDISFGNSTVIGGCTNIENLSINDVEIENLNDSTNFQLGANSEVKLKFTTKKDTIYWLKMNPSSGVVDLDFTECIIKVDA